MECMIITTTTTAVTATMIPWRTWKCHCIRYQPTARSPFISSNNNSYQSTASSPQNRGIRWLEGVWDIPSLASTTIIHRRRAQPAVICINYRIRRSTQITEVPWQTWTTVPGIMTNQLMCWITHTAEGQGSDRTDHRTNRRCSPNHYIKLLICVPAFPFRWREGGWLKATIVHFFLF